MTRNLDECTPELKTRWDKCAKEARALGIELVPYCTARTELEQAVIYITGRIADDNAVTIIRRELNMGFDKRILTHTLMSEHVVTAKRPKSRAIDFYVKKNGKPMWTSKGDSNGDHYPDYLQVAEIFRRNGLVPGADWGDFDHVQIRK